MKIIKKTLSMIFLGSIVYFIFCIMCNIWCLTIYLFEFLYGKTFMIGCVIIWIIVTPIVVLIWEYLEERSVKMIDITINKKCLDCGHCQASIDGEKIEYNCDLSKKKFQDCLREIQDYFKEV